MPLAVGLYADAYVAVWTPAGLAGLVGWWDASDTASITHSSGAVSQWNDKSGNARHVTQATAGNKPTTGAATINGRNVLSFDGTADKLDGPVAQLVNATTGQWSAFVVARTSTISGTHGMINQDNQGATRIWVVATNATALEIYVFNTADTPFGDTTTTVAVNTPVMFSAVRSASAIEGWLNGTSTGATTTTGTNKTSTHMFRIGAPTSASSPQHWQGDIAEIVMYSTALSTTDRQAVESYLKTKWGTP